MSELPRNPIAPDRRTVIKGGAGALAALAGLGMASLAQAQGTPEAVGTPGQVGLFAVTRTYVVKDEADVDALNAIVEEFAAIVSQTPGFVNYNVVFDEATRGYVTIGVFEDQASAEASTEAASDFVAEQNLGDYFVDATPVILQGAIAISVSA